MGVSSAFAQLYRFAAAEAVTPERRGRAISLVLAGGLLAGFIGPQLARSTADLLGTRFVASFLCIPLLALGSMGLMLGLRLPEAVEPRVAGAARPVVAIVRQPLFLVAVASEVAGYGVMNLLMTGTPLAIVAHHGHGLRDAAFVIEWHLVGMFLPGFFTGSLIQRIGERATIALGIGVNGGAWRWGLRRLTVWHFWLSLLLVGVGWNLMFVGGSTLVTRTYTPDERTKAQAANDFLIWATVAVTSLSSGQLLHRHGWTSILVTAARCSRWRPPRSSSPRSRADRRALDARGVTRPRYLRRPIRYSHGAWGASVAHRPRRSWRASSSRRGCRRRHVALVAQAELLQHVARPRVLRACHRDDPGEPRLVEPVRERRPRRLGGETLPPGRALEGVQDLDLAQLVDRVEAALTEEAPGPEVLDGEDAVALLRPVPDELLDGAPRSHRDLVAHERAAAELARDLRVLVEREVNGSIRLRERPEAKPRRAEDDHAGTAAGYVASESSGKIGRRIRVNAKRVRFDEERPGASTSTISRAIGSKAAR